MVYTDKQVLAIQSHVVHGYVGNKAATLPLQVRGWDVDCINAVQFSNHTGYGHVEGYKLSGDQIRNLFKGLMDQDFCYTALLSGYLPSADAVESIAEIGTALQQKNKDLIWVLDPVMGDGGKLYVKEDVIPVYKKILETCKVTLTTPNHFEVEILTGIKLDSMENVLKALKYMYDEYKVDSIVISSVPHAHDANTLLTVGSTRTGPFSGRPFVIKQKKIDSYFTGTGDLFAALMLDSLQRVGIENLADASCRAISAISKVLARTHAFGVSHDTPCGKMADRSMKFHELRLVQSVDILANTDTHDVEWSYYE